MGPDQRFLRVLDTSPFRIAIVYSIVFACGAAALLGAVDFADMITRDRLCLHARERAGIDRFLDRDHGGAGFAGAEPKQDRGARHQRLVVQPENPRADSPCIARAISDMGDHVATFDE